jgi:hypothetical protein
MSLRKGPGLARPTALATALSRSVQEYLLGEPISEDEVSPEQVARLRIVLEAAIDTLNEDDRLHIRVELNLIKDHQYARLTDRQESLAAFRKCAAKTIRRQGERAVKSLTYKILSRSETGSELADRSTAGRTETASVRHRPPDQEAREPAWHDEVRAFWNLSDTARVDIVCSEIPVDERPEYASPADRNYLRYAKFADLDTLIYLRTRLAQIAPRTIVRDFAPSEYYDTQADILVIAGGPPWNAKYREFLPQLPYYFEPHPLGEDDPLVFPDLNQLTLGPRWTPRQELLEDLVVLTRLTLSQGTRVFLLGGCLTLGVLGAAHCLLEGERGARSVRYIAEHVGDDDFVLVTEVRRLGGLTDIADLSKVNPLLLLSRQHNEPFKAVVDNTTRYLGLPAPTSGGHR